MRAGKGTADAYDAQPAGWWGVEMVELMLTMRNLWAGEGWKGTADAHDALSVGW